MSFFGLLNMLFVGLFIIYMTYVLRSYLPLWGWFLWVRDFISCLIRVTKPSTYARQFTEEEMLFSEDDETSEVVGVPEDTGPCAPIKGVELTELQTAMINTMTENGVGVLKTARVLSNQAGMNISTARRALRELLDLDLVQREGEGNIASPYVWAV